MTNGAVVAIIRTVVAHDLAGTTRSAIEGQVARMKSDLTHTGDEALLLARMLARISQDDPIATTQGKGSMAQIAVVERARELGIRVEEFEAGRVPADLAPVVSRAFAGMPTLDFVRRTDDGTARINQVAVAPIYDGERINRVAVASVPIGRKFLREQRSMLGSDVTLLSDEGVVASSSACLECGKCLEDVLFKDGEWKKIAEGKALYITSDCQPDPHAVIVTPFRFHDGKLFAIALAKSRKAESAALVHSTWTILGGVAVLGLLNTVAFIYMLARVVRPLRELTKMASDISAGRYGETVPVKGNDEVADLTDAFNRMSVAQRAAVEEISRWNVGLEKRVQEKTAEIEVFHRHMVEVEKLAAMGQLSAGVAHEINNPLSGILGYAELGIEIGKTKVEVGLTPAETEKFVRFFKHIESLSHRCRAIVLDMLKFARQHTEEIREYDLNATIRQMLMFVDKQVSRGNVKVDVELAEGVPAMSGNPVQIQQVFTNLVLNAVQAMPSGGGLSIRSRITGGGVEISFHDTGTGISMENMKRIFDPFFSTKPVGEGTGLGLSVSYGLVRQHGGEIRVASEVGAGTTFTVVLPFPPVNSAPSA